MKIVWTKQALNDLASLRRYIADENPAAAIKTADRIAAAVEALSRHPELGRTGRVAGSRELVVTGTPFIVAYRVVAKIVAIVAVLHGARRWPDEF